MATTVVTYTDNKYTGNIVYYSKKLYVFPFTSTSANNWCKSFNINADGNTDSGQTFITNAEYISVYGMVQLYNNYFYLINNSTNTILKYMLDGVFDSSFSISTSAPIGNAIADNILYVSTNEGSTVNTYSLITKTRTDSTVSPFLTVTGQIVSLAISETTLYVATNNGTGTIYFYNIINKSYSVSIGGVGIVYGMVLDGKYLYTTKYGSNQDNVNKYNKDTGSLVFKWSIDITTLRGIALSNNYMYVSSQSQNGSVYKIANRYYYPCFLEGSKILKFNPDTQTEQYVPIETLRTGDLIKTSDSGYKAISHIGKTTLPDPATNPDIKDRLYVFSSKWAIKTDNASEASEDLGPLCLTGRHCLLHANLSETEIKTVKQFTGDIYITENKYRVPAYLDARREPYTKTDLVTIWHFALENDSKHQNYGVYANGILVESSSIEYMTEFANMELV